jgi:hypothetical protein
MGEAVDQTIYTNLNVQQQQLVEARVANDRKSVGLAYVLWFFLGLWGIHNFYLSRPKLALFQLLGAGAAVVIILTAGGSGSGGLGAVGGLILIAWGLTFIGDVFFIPGRAKRYSEELRAKFSQQIAAQGTGA